MMDKAEFRKQAYANPAQPSAAMLDAARMNPGYQRLLEQIRALEKEISSAVNTVPVPAGLQQRLLALPDESGATPESLGTDYPGHRTGRSGAPVARPALYVAFAASLLLTLGVFFIQSSDRGLSPTEVALGDVVLEHLYEFKPQFNAMRDGTLDRDYAMPTINAVVANTGFRISSAGFMQNMPVRYANPCDIFPEHQAAHLMLQSSAGAVNVIITNSLPVSREFSIRDDRFAGLVIPLDNGNLILVGERPQSLEPYRYGLRNNLERLI